MIFLYHLRTVQLIFFQVTNQISKFFYNHEGLRNGNNIPMQLQNLKHLNINTLKNYTKKIYTPTNTLFVISGNFHKASVLNLFKQHLPKNNCPGRTNMIFNYKKPINKSQTIFIPNRLDLIPWNCLIVLI